MNVQAHQASSHKRALLDDEEFKGPKKGKIIPLSRKRRGATEMEVPAIKKERITPATLKRALLVEVVTNSPKKPRIQKLAPPRASVPRLVATAVLPQPKPAVLKDVTNKAEPPRNPSIAPPAGKENNKAAVAPQRATATNHTCPEDDLLIQLGRLRVSLR